MPPPLQEKRLCVICNFVINILVTVQCALFKIFAYVFALDFTCKPCKDTAAKVRDNLCDFLVGRLYERCARPLRKLSF